MNRPREVYSHGHHESVLRSHRWRTAENSAGYLLPRLRRTDRLLDIGCGPGTITVDFAARLDAGHVVGLDEAADVLVAARREATDRGQDRVDFLSGNVYDLDFADHSFDVVHAHQVLQHLRDPVAALREMKRVCRPGGLVAARDADYAAMTWYPASPGLDRWLELYQQVARAGGGEPDAGRRLRSWALSAGFTAVEASASVWCFASEYDVSWWSDSWADRVVESSFGQQALDGGFADAEQLAQLAVSWRTWGAAPDAWFAILHGEVIATA